ncbi:MAG: class I SAM-dependent methyltransferase [Candidatus Parabeggiatoa sp.]|nr:class I SAM-dependent methyltransferase [Candidatus Parabeggiatoa sp.]
MSQYYPPTPRYLFRRYEILRHIKRGGTFLEIGAGNFQLSTELLSYFDTGVALDFHPEMADIYAGLCTDLKNRLEMKRADFLSTHFTDTYDCVVACEVMEHVINDVDFINKVYQLLNPNGQAIISVPARMKYWAKDDEMAGHIRRYEKDALLRLFQKAQFKHIIIISYGYPFVNLLRLARILMAKQQYKERINWSQEQLTQKSGVNRVPFLLRFFVKKNVFLPFNLMASLFNRFDLSEGYLVIAEA